MEIVTKEEYWTTILNDPTQFGQITTEDTEFNSIANDVWNVLENSFIKVDDEESVIKWEEVTGLDGEGLTLSQRKDNILYTLTVKNYFHISLFTQAMNRLVGEGNYFIVFNEETQRYEVKCYEDYETSASFLNKRLSNGWVDLEISPLPFLYLAAEFLENHQPVAISVPVNKSLAGFSFEQCHAYSSDVTGDESATTNNNLRLQIGRWGNSLFVWVFASQAGGSYPPDVKKVMRIDVDATTAKVYLDNTFAFEQTGTTSGSVIVYNAFSRNSNSCFAGKKYWVKMRHNGEMVRDLIPCITPDGKPAFFDKVSKNHYEASNTESYIAGLTLSQALKLSKLPATGGTLTVSLPWEAQLITSGIPAILRAAAAKGWTITIQYREPEEDNEYYNRYAECEKVADMSVVNADYKNDLTKDGEWVYPLPKAINLKDAFYNNYNLKAFSVTELPEVTDLHDTFIGTKLERIKLNVPKLTHLFGTFGYVSTLKWAEVQLKNAYPTDMLGSFRECPLLSHVRINLDHLRNSSWLFDRCQLDKDSTLHILTQLRTFTDGGTHNLSIGIHTDLQTDEEVTAAIADAEAKGWTLTVQWTGTATAAAVSTFGFRKPPIYAKLGTLERSDGTTENALDWGHYVTNWEENGYQEFSSIEEAEEYFNINQTEEV